MGVIMGTAALPQDVPLGLKTYLHRCLQKDPTQRVQAIGDVRLAIEGAFEPPLSHSAERRASLARGWWRPIPVSVVMLTIGLIGGYAGWGLISHPSSPAGRFVVSSAQPLRVSAYEPDVAISPDGKHVVYAAGSAQLPQLYVRPVDRLTGMLIESGELSASPFISPDGAWVGFLSGRDLIWKRAPVTGGPPVDLFPAPGPGGSRGASWGADDTIVFARGVGAGGLLQGSEGEAPVMLTEPDAAKGETRHYQPQILPGGGAVLFTIVKDLSEGGEVAVLDLTTGEQKTLIPVGSGPQYATSGHLVYGTRGALWAAPFDLERLEVTGDSVRVVEGVQLKRNTIANFSLSLEGSLAYVAADAEQDLQRTLVWVDRQGHEESLDAPPRPYVSARAAPGGDRIALELADEGRDVWIWDLVRESLTRFTFDANGDDERPLWTPDGERVVFQSTRDGFFKIYWKAADGSGTVERLGVDDPASAQLPMAISSDGTRLVFAQAGQQRDLYMMTLDGEPVADPLLVTPFSEADADVSPNGRWLSYESDASGQAEIYVSSFPNIDGALLISRDGGFTPRWGPRGDELFYRGSQGLMRVPITWNPGPEPGASELLFSLADFCFYGCFSSTLYVAVE